MWRQRPGSLPVGARLAIAAACVVSVVLAYVGPRLIWAYEWIADDADAWWLRDAPALACAAVIALAIVVPGRTSRFARVALALPIGQLAAIVTLCSMWSRWPVKLGYYEDGLPLLSALPPHVVLPVVAALVVAGGISIGRRETLQATVTLALSLLLTTGLWLPLACRVWFLGKHDEHVHALHLHASQSLVAFVLVPPALAALAYTILTFRRVKLPALRIVVVALLALALLAYATMGEGAQAMFDNFVHCLLAIGDVAIGALVLLSASIVVRPGLRGRRVEGTIAADEGIVARVEIASWLRGPRAVVGPFAVTTASGNIHVPGGTLVGPLPVATTQLHVGEALPVLRGGDRVVLTGFTASAGDHPFRASDMPVADDVRIARPDEAPARFASAAYALWRPSLAYLVILVAVGAPALVGAILSLR